MSIDKAFRAYGRLLVTWNSLQPVLDVAIVRESGLDITRGALITAGLTPKSRLTVLRGLLSHAGGEKADIAPLLAELSQAARKLPLLQGNPLPGQADALLVVRPEGGKQGGTSTEFSADQISHSADDLAAQIDTLTAALAVTPADILALRKAGEELAAKRRKETDAEE